MLALFLPVILELTYLS